MSFSRDIETLVSVGEHPNVAQLIGVCEELDTTFVVLEDGGVTMKQALLDSRALVHQPAYAEKHGRVSTTSEEDVLDMLVGVANGMEHLAKAKVTRNCTRVFVYHFLL